MEHDFEWVSSDVRWAIATFLSPVVLLLPALLAMAKGEPNGQYNTVDSALASGDVITLLGATAEVRSPSLFFHPNAFGIGTVKLPKLSATDVVATTEDGFSIRVTRYSDGDKNKNMVRFDMLPAFITFNPFFAGQGFGS